MASLVVSAAQWERSCIFTTFCCAALKSGKFLWDFTYLCWNLTNLVAT
jgi:hypothetical protein